MIKVKMVGLIVLVVIMLSGCPATTKNVPPPPGGGALADNEEITGNIDSIIESMMDQLGEPPQDVIGFGAGYKRKTAITPSESGALFKLYRTKSNYFGSYDMGCSPTVILSDMETYSPEAESAKRSGFAPGNNIWVGKAGYSKYDRLGNFPDEIKRVAIDMVSLDKTTKKASTETAQAEIDRGSIYGYWIISLPDDNNLDGVVYEKGADHKLKPVKKGILFFKRVGPGPVKGDLKVDVNKAGKYKSEAELTAGYYNVSFDADDGKGKQNLTKSGPWLYIPGESPTKDWTVVVRDTYSITFDFKHRNLSDGVDTFETHMEWHDIPIDWDIESEEALSLGTSLGYQGMYCLTYDYFDSNPDALKGIPGYKDEDEEETEITPGYPPNVLTEKSANDGSISNKITQKPTLSFFRASKGSVYLEDAYYMNLEYGAMIFDGNQPIMDIPYIICITPEVYKFEGMFEEQGWENMSRIARLEEKAAKELIENGTPLVITWQDKAKTIQTFKVVIKVEE